MQLGLAALDLEQRVSLSAVRLRLRLRDRVRVRVRVRIRVRVRLRVRTPEAVTTKRGALPLESAGSSCWARAKCPMWLVPTVSS